MPIRWRICKPLAKAGHQIGTGIARKRRAIRAARSTPLKTLRAAQLNDPSRPVLKYDCRRLRYKIIDMKRREHEARVTPKQRDDVPFGGKPEQRIDPFAAASTVDLGLDSP